MYKFSLIFFYIDYILYFTEQFTDNYLIFIRKQTYHKKTKNIDSTKNDII
jgi:hypothetical protein